jgi:hypothetical protein
LLEMYGICGQGRRLLSSFTQKARDARENLWPKFILTSAPLRATSSGCGKASP